ncbi:LysR family transcriptional regulator [Jannaschia aquimarina]|uniref:GltC_2 protein n=1 Tax=Jannaschia aquimarina TaxID=935700 RepID=A0A0D1EF43_9RHOB|nr:LysR family transcriptional regulator [Jannaschia aquimarina]KIT16259.1 HTH-type transcriptional regulator GltC [Jannaschia aquimarina]SNT15096.1 DNA-binding transcriptional regulator, LysR family [Jannaschia aquimarina]
MKIDALRAFQLVVEHGTLSAAARVLNISEPALSRSISALERELRLELFDRTGRQLRPTETGRAFLQEIQPVLSGLERIGDFAAEIRAGSRRRVRLVSMPRLSTAITAPVVARFKAAHPEVDLSVDIQPRRLLETWITGQRFDLGLSSLPARHRDIDTRLLFELPAVAVLPVGHRLAKAEAVTVEDLTREAFLTLSPGTLLRQQTEAIFGHANALLRPVVEVSQAMLACQLVMQGTGVTICDPMLPSAWPERLTCVPIAPRYRMAFGMHFLRGQELGPEAQELVRLTREVADGFLEAQGLPPQRARELGAQPSAMR